MAFFAYPFTKGMFLLTPDYAPDMQPKGCFFITEKHNGNYVVFYMSCKSLTSQQSEFLQLLSMLCSAFEGVDACGFNTGMTEQIRQSYNILLQAVKCPGKQVSEIVRKYLIL